jgi:hypothetical protein
VVVEVGEQQRSRIDKIHGVPGREIFEGRLDEHFRFTFHIQRNVLVLRNIDHYDKCLENP